MSPLETKIHEWANRRFGPRKKSSRMRKLGEEYGELAEAVANDDREAIIAEAADCAIVLTDLLAIVGASLTEAVVDKIAFNEARTERYQLHRDVAQEAAAEYYRYIESGDGTFGDGTLTKLIDKAIQKAIKL